MNNELSTTNKENDLWEEKNLIEQKMNYLNNNEIVQKDIINDIKKDSMKNQCKNTGIISGIYKIVNKIDGKYYVGSSCDIQRRWKTHIYYLTRNRHINDYLQNAWNKYGNNSFELLIVELSDKEKNFLVEQKYLDIAKTEQDKCYNLNFESKGGCISDYAIQKMKSFKVDYFKKIENRKKLSEQYRGNKNPNYGNHKLAGKNHPLFDHKKYNFFNLKNGMSEQCTRFDLKSKYNLDKDCITRLVKGEYKSHKGWIIKH